MGTSTDEICGTSGNGSIADVSRNGSTNSDKGVTEMIFSTDVAVVGRVDGDV